MAQMRKRKTDDTGKVQPRKAAAKASAGSPRSYSEIRRLLAETQDQLSLIHGVLEELCERQEALAAWQMEFSKRLVTLQEAQWRSLEDLAGVDMGRPVEKAFGLQLEHTDPEALDDQLDEASRLLDELNSQSQPKRADRLRRRRSPLFRRSQENAINEEVSSADDLPKQEAQTPLESVFVMPAKVDVH